MRKRIHAIFFALIFAAGIYLRARDLFAPWKGIHNAWGGAMYGNIARNYLKYGYLATHFGPVSNLGIVSPSEFQYYYHHPPLLYWLVSLSFRFFGVSEWSARLVPLVFSVALLLLIYVVGARLFDRKVGLLAAAFAAIMPMETYYGAHVDVYGSVAVAFSLLAFYGYIRWVGERQTADLALCVAGVVLGCMTAWYTYFLIPLILVHYYWFHYWRGRSRDHRLLILPACAVAIFGLFMLHRKWLLRDSAEIEGALTEKLIRRLSFGEHPMRLAARHLVDVLNLYTQPLALLVAAWVCFFAWDVFRRRLQASDWLLLILFGYGLLHNAMFPGSIRGHDFIGICYTPAMALAAAVASLRIVALAGRAVPQPAVAAVAYACAALIVAFGIYRTQARFAADSPGWFYALKQTGQSIHASVGERDLVLMPVADAVLNYYVDRQVRAPVTTFDEVMTVSRERGARCFYACPAPQVDSNKDLISQLDAKFPRIRQDDPIIYTLTAQSSN